MSVWAATRPEAIARLSRVLDEYHIDGIKTTIPFFKEILKQDDFIKGNLDTGYIERNWNPTSTKPTETPETKELQHLAALVTAIHHNSNNQKSNNQTINQAKQSAWRLSTRAKGRGF